MGPAILCKKNVQGGIDGVHRVFSAMLFAQSGAEISDFLIWDFERLTVSS
jgi:hypothetical protein